MPRRVRQLQRVAVLAGLCTLTTPAAAQPQPDAPADANKGDAKELMQLGVKLLSSKDYLGALAVFKDAYSRFPSPKILLNIGTTLKLLDRNAEAVNTYQRYLDSPDADQARRPEVTAEMERLDRKLGRLEITAPAEAEIQIDDQDWAPAPSARLYRVAPGSYTLRARRDGYQPFEQTGTMEVGQSVAVTIELAVIPKAVSQVFVPVPASERFDDEPALAPEPRSRLGLLARGHFDVDGGAATFIGGTFDVTRQLRASAAAIIGPNFGGYVAAHFAFLTGTIQPIVAVGMPIFFNDGARVAIRGAAGVEIVANSHFSFLVELGVEHLFNPQPMVEFGGMLRSINSTSLIPAFGVTARL